jgi:extracellular factor (EF) 3-hydroxypalmitic acid methyl ester biosynthesis protein
MRSANGAKDELRSDQRVLFPFPVYMSNGMIGETVNISDTGLCLGLERDVSNSLVLSLEIEFPFSKDRVKVFGEKIWERNSDNGGRHLLGLRVLNPKPDYLSRVREAREKRYYVNEGIVNSTNQIRAYLLGIKKECDQLDHAHPTEKEQKAFLASIQRTVYATLTKYLKGLHKTFPSFSEEAYQIHRKYCQVMLRNVFIDNVEVNRHVLHKPFDYAGDFMLINYYYDYHDKHLGITTYEKLINHFSLNLFISRSVIRRKEFFKKKIRDVIRSKDQARILSLGSGSAKELTELLREGGIRKDFWFDCLDFEKESIRAVKKELDGIKGEAKKHLNITYINKGLIEIVKENSFDFGKPYDLIYSSGLFDYLKDRVATKMVHNLFSVLKADGELIVTNASAKTDHEQMYYGMLGEWDLLYRHPADLLKWTAELSGAKDVAVIDPGAKNAFLFLRLRK